MTSRNLGWEWGQALTSGMYLWILSCALNPCLSCIYIFIFISPAFHTFINIWRMKWSLSGHFEWWQVVTFCLDTTRFVCTCAMWRQRRAAGEEVVRSDKGSSNTHRAGRGKCPRRGFPSTSSPQHATHLLLSLEVCCIAVASQNSGSIWIWLLYNWQVLVCFIFIQPSCLCDTNMYISVSGENEQNPIFGWFVRKPCQIPIMVDGPGQLHVSCRSKVRPLPLGGPPLRAFRPCGPWKMVGR